MDARKPAAHIAAIGRSRGSSASRSGNDPALICQAPGTCPASYSDAWRTSMTRGRASGPVSAPWASDAASSSMERRPLASTGRPAGLPGLDATREIAGHRVVADPHGLAHELVEIVRRLDHEDDGLRRDPRPSRATSRTIRRAGSRANPGYGRRRGGAARRASTMRAPRATAASVSTTDNAGASRHDPAEQPRTGLVRGPHPGEVARGRRLAGEQGARERVHVHRREHRVVAALVADRRRRGRADPGGAQRSGAVGRVDRHAVVEGHDPIVE